MFRRVLVPLDGAAADRACEERAIEVARQLAEREGARLVLVHVDDEAAGAPDAAHAAIIRRAADLSGAGAQVSVHFATGAPDDGIAHTAREERADLIVLAPHQRSLLRTFLQPGVTGQLMRRAPAPLLIWPERPSVPHDTALDAMLTVASAAPVIVPLDGGPEAERALPLAAAFAQAHQRSLLLVTVAAPMPPFIGLEMSYPGVALPTGTEGPEDRLREVLRYLGRVRRELRAQWPDLGVQTTARIGEVAPVVAEMAAAHPGTVVVMTTHGRGRALRLLLGSVAMELLSLTPAPLLIVPSRRRSVRRPELVAGARLEAGEAEEAGDDEDEGALDPALEALEPRPSMSSEM